MTLARKIGRALAAPIRRLRVRNRRKHVGRLTAQIPSCLGITPAQAERIVYGNNIAFVEEPTAGKEATV